MRNTRLLFRTICALFLSSGMMSCVYAQVPSFTATHYNSDNIGLSHNTVLSIAEDQQGFIWVSTMDGLNRFDGKKVKIYRNNPDDSTSISDSFIHGVNVLKDGRLWIGTRDGGVSILDPVTDKIERIVHDPGDKYSIPDAPTNLVFEDSEGSFWIGFFDSSVGLFDLEKKHFKTAVLEEQFTGEIIRSVNSVIEFNDGSFLITSLFGIYYIESEELNDFREDPVLNNKINVIPVIYSLSSPKPNTIIAYKDNRDAIWVEMLPEGFHPLDPELMPSKLRESILTGVARNSVEKIIVERSGYIIKGGGDGNVEVIDTETRERWQQKLIEQDAPLGTAKLFEDKEGNIWFGSWGNGFFHLKEKKGIDLINRGTGATQLPSNFMLSFEDGENGLWIGMGDGLSFWLDGTPQSSLRNQRSFAEKSIWNIERDDLGLWLATRIDGLNFISNEEIGSNRLRAKEFNPNNSFLLNRHVHQVLRDSRGWLWLGYEGQGIQILKNVESWLEGEPANVVHLTTEGTEPRINSMKIRKIVEDDDGNIWIGSNDNGANYLTIRESEISGVVHFGTADDADIQISHNNVRNILQQNDSTFWLATYGGGIHRWVKGSKTTDHFTTNNGLANNSTYGILKDEDPGLIWISTNNGLSRLDTETLRFTNYTTADGLQNNEFNTGAYFKRKNGDLVFGGVNGFNIIDTKALTVNHEIPPVYITGTNLFNKPYHKDSTALFNKSLELTHDENFLSFEFAALDYEDPTANEYAYKMEGVDPDWVYSGNRNFADYPNLVPGNYTFRVKAANSDGYWNEEGASLAITIYPPWWQSTWFRVLFITVLLASIIGSVRYFSQRKLRQQIRKMEIENRLRNERERISRDLHDHVGAQLANIISGLSLVDKYNEFEQKDKSQSLMHSLKGDAEVTIKQLRETIWALNQSELDLESFSEHLRAYFKNQSALTESLKINLTINEAKPTKLSSTQALNLFRIIQEASQNTLKYAGAENLDINFERQNGMLIVSVKDDGEFKGDQSDFNGGYGMKNMSKRAHEIGGKVEVNTGNGTEVIVRVKI